jgi:type I restriction enzyme R subunit
MDGANDVLQNAFNRLYCSPRKVAFMDKKSHFRSLVSFFEVFLKKIYFIENGKEMVVTRENARPGEMPALGDCIYQTPCLKRLKYEPDSNKFKIWLQQLRDWRNEQSHQAPIATEAEYDTAIHIVTALYLYVTAYNIKYLQPKMFAQLVSMNAEPQYIGMAAEPETTSMVADDSNND